MEVSRIACTFPGKFGDLLWALPTVRAISETYDQPVNLILSDYLAPIVPLLNQQPYIQQAVSYPVWQVEMTAPISPRVPPTEFNFDRIYHLGYQGWPLRDLPHEVQATWLSQYQSSGDHFEPFGIDLQRPWITTNDIVPRVDVAIGFTDEYFELKYGLYSLVSRGDGVYRVLCPAGSRWETEGGWTTGYGSNWEEAARTIKASKVFLGCCSALHVLSCAMGKPTVVMEPNEHRWHPIFWPEAVRDRVHLVLGNDGKPTFDARAVRAAVEKFL